MNLFFKAWDQGAYNSVIAAALPKIREKQDIYKGVYIEGNYGLVKKPSKTASDHAISAELWKTTEEFLESIGLN